MQFLILPFTANSTQLKTDFLLVKVNLRFVSVGFVGIDIIDLPLFVQSHAATCTYRTE